MKFLLHILSVTMAVYSAQACRDNSCSAFCAGEKKDPSKKLTFYRKSDLDKFNKNFEGDEQFIYLSKGKCEYKDDCNKIPKKEICAIPEPGASGFPKTFRNFCDMNRHNCDNPKNEYLYYHDRCCNALKDPTPSKKECDCLECGDPWKPVCAFPKNPVGAQPISFSNHCWLKKFNCENSDQLFFYWHEARCLA